MTRAITRIHVAGYRSLRDVTLEPGRITVLVGPNGAGKSNLLSLLQMVPLLYTGSLQRFISTRGGASALLHYGPKVTPVLSFQLDFSQDRGDAYAVALEYAAGDTLVFQDEVVHYLKPDGTRASLIVDASHRESKLYDIAWSEEGHRDLQAVSERLSDISFYHFHDTSITAALRQNARAADDRRLRSDGSNLAAFLLRLKRSRERAGQVAWKRINLLVRRIAPSIKQLRPPPDSEEAPRHVRLDWIDDRDAVFGAHDLSDGTLRAIALVTALAQPASTLPAFITIDEPELGLHPAALTLVAGQVRSISSRCQVLLATQSPALLDHFAPEDVVVVERAHGASTFRRLDPADLSEWLAEYSLSELYDKNLLGGGRDPCLRGRGGADRGSLHQGRTGPSPRRAASG